MSTVPYFKSLVPFQAAVGFVAAERVRQNALWGGVSHDILHTNEEWLEIIERLVYKAHHYVDGVTCERRFEEIAAVAIAAIESNYIRFLENGDEPT